MERPGRPPASRHVAHGTGLPPAALWCLGSLARASLPFQVVYPIWWYLGPLNPENGLSAIDYVGLHEAAIVNLAPAAVVAASLAAVGATLLLARRQGGRN